MLSHSNAVFIFQELEWVGSTHETITERLMIRHIEACIQNVSSSPTSSGKKKFCRKHDMFSVLSRVLEGRFPLVYTFLKLLFFSSPRLLKSLFPIHIYCLTTQIHKSQSLCSKARCVVLVVPYLCFINVVYLMLS